MKNTKKILKHIGIALGIIVLLVFITLQMLRDYTNHGESIEVPSLKGLSVTQAAILLEENDLAYEIIDSVYKLDIPPGTVWEQTPVAGEKVKSNREIYLVINSYLKPNISLPDIRDLSYRNARATLEAMGLKIQKVEYVPSEFKNLVKDVKVNGTVITPGSRLPIETAVVLVVGGTADTTEIITPSLRGLKYNEAALRLFHESLNVRLAQFDGNPENADDSLQYVVYKQAPIKGSPIYVGSSVTIWLSKDKTLLSGEEEDYSTSDSIKKSTKKDIEEFF